MENKSFWGPQGEANVVHVVGFWWDKSAHLRHCGSRKKTKQNNALDFSHTDVFVVFKSFASQNYGWVLERNTANALLRLIVANLCVIILE